MEEQDVGLLYNKQNIILQRKFFSDNLRLHGVNVKYYIPREGKHYTIYGELETNYKEPLNKSILYEEHPKQSTFKKLGWNAELLEGQVLIQVEYNLPEIQVGCIFALPAAMDGAQPRLFKVTKMTTIDMFPANISCACAPVLESTTPSSMSEDYTKSNFNFLKEEV